MTAGAADDLLTVEEIAEEFRVPAGTFRSWRAQGRGPKSFKIGRRVVYRRSDARAWLAQQEQATARGDQIEQPSRIQTAAASTSTGEKPTPQHQTTRS